MLQPSTVHQLATSLPPIEPLPAPRAPGKRRRLRRRRISDWVR